MHLSTCPWPCHRSWQYENTIWKPSIAFSTTLSKPQLLLLYICPVKSEKNQQTCVDPKWLITFPICFKQAPQSKTWTNKESSYRICRPLYLRNSHRPGNQPPSDKWQISWRLILVQLFYPPYRIMSPRGVCDCMHWDLVPLPYQNRSDCPIFSLPSLLLGFVFVVGEQR